MISYDDIMLLVRGRHDDIMRLVRVRRDNITRPVRCRLRYRLVHISRRIVLPIRFDIFSSCK